MAYIIAQTQNNQIVNNAFESECTNYYARKIDDTIYIIEVALNGSMEQWEVYSDDPVDYFVKYIAPIRKINL